MIKDRGNKKWVSLMLTEHRRALKKLKQKDLKQERPEPAADLCREMNYCFQEALRYNRKVNIKFYREGRQISITGRIKKGFPLEKRILVEAAGENRDYNLQIADIFHLELC